MFNAKPSSTPVLASTQAQRWPVATVSRAIPDFSAKRNRFGMRSMCCVGGGETGVQSMKKFLVVWRAIDQVRPSPENRQLYKPVSRKDPAVRRLADQIRKYGVLEPIVITSDGCILSGHRRWVAAQIAGLKRVPVRVYPVSHDRQPEKFLDLLQAFNGYRHKSHDELLHKEIISHNREDAYQALIDYREERALITIEPNIEIRDYKARSEITEAKRLSRRYHRGHKRAGCVLAVIGSAGSLPAVEQSAAAACEQTG